MSINKDMGLTRLQLGLEGSSPSEVLLVGGGGHGVQDGAQGCLPSAAVTALYISRLHS